MKFQQKSGKRTDATEPTETRTVPRTEGARLVRELRERVGGNHLARLLGGVSESQLRMVGACQRSPSEELKVKLAAHGVPLDSWTPTPDLASMAGRSPASGSPKPVNGGAQVVESSDPLPVGTTLAELDDQIRRLKRQAVAADKDPLCSIRDRSSAGAALNAAIRMRSQTMGESELSETKVVRSVYFQAALGRLVGCLDCARCLAAVEREFRPDADGTRS